jgi:predicted amidohydrolase
MMVNPWGILLASGGDEEAVLKADIDLNEVESARARFPALADRQEWLQK